MTKIPLVSVIIPFFQKEKGFLKRAILSVLGQKNFDNYEIIIVDDGSPISAQEEMVWLPQEEGKKIKIINQKNAGAGAARNKGLDFVSRGVRYVAFLDSDDQWKTGHLENAIFALDKGYDFYFSNGWGYTKNKYKFDNLSSMRLDSHLLINNYRNLYEFLGDFFDVQIYQSIILTSSVVYRYEKFSYLRFNEDLFNGQDLFFWLCFSKLSDKIAFSSNNEVLSGEGDGRVAIWDKSGWGHGREMVFSQNLIKLYKCIERTFILTKSQRKCLDQQIHSDRYVFCAAFFHYVKIKQKISLKVLFNQLKIDFLTYLLLPLNVIKVLITQVKKLKPFLKANKNMLV